MKKILVGLMASAVFLVGCGNSDDRPAPEAETITETITETVTEPPETVTITPEPEPAPEPDTGSGLSDQQFVDIMREELGLDSSLSGSTIVAAAREVCGMFDSGASATDVLEYLVGEGFPAYEAGFFTAGSVDTYCPEYNSLLDEFSGGSGDAA